MATPGLVSTPATAVGMLVVGSLGTAMSDVVIDSIVVEKSRSAESQVGRHTQQLSERITYSGHAESRAAGLQQQFITA